LNDKKENIVKEMTVMNLMISRNVSLCIIPFLVLKITLRSKKELSALELSPGFPPPLYNESSLYKFPLSRRLKPPHIITDS
jgi:hypothetical protein